jgi:uncharacterized protein YbaA (DUF1428 family)
MTKLDAMRQIVSAPRDHADQGKIGKVQKYAKPDGRERIVFAWKVLTSITKRRAS